MLKDEGGPAFPIVGEPITFEGITIRDYFAALALSGIIAEGSSRSAPSVIAAWAYEIADAMIAARRQDPRK